MMSDTDDSARLRAKAWLDDMFKKGLPVLTQYERVMDGAEGPLEPELLEALDDHRKTLLVSTHNNLLYHTV